MLPIAIESAIENCFSCAMIETESEIVAFRKYYNDIITDYNKMVKTFPSNFVGMCSKYKVKTYFDGKDNSKNDNVKL